MKFPKIFTAVSVAAAVMAPQLAQADDAKLKEALDGALAIISAKGYEGAALDEMKANGYVELENSGLHVFATDANGVILFDLSGQTEPGVDLSGVADMEGNETAAYIKEAANGANDGFVRTKGSWPHPTKGTMFPSDFYCKKKDDNTVCAMIWLTN